jgi:murein DD-endopeptidase MepM/ murein hydrolase activator NlpD
MLIPDGAEVQQGWRVPRWTLWAALGTIGIILAGITLFFIFYGSMASRAATTERVQAENEALLRYRYKVLLLEENLKEVRTVVTRLTKLAGVDYQFPEVPTDSQINAVVTRAAETGDTVSLWTSRVEDIPVGLPLKGYVSQEFNEGDPSRFHTGIDIACASGTPVAATATGDVIFAGFDSTYGNMLVLRHNDSVSTVYGHNDTLLVTRGQRVQAGAIIARSGSTGVSTAPHLHYEVRLNGKSVNPLEQTHDQENNH